MDPQISIYVDACKDLGYEIAGCIYDIIRKPRIRPRKKTKLRMTKGKPCKSCGGKVNLKCENPHNEYELCKCQNTGFIRCTKCDAGWAKRPKPYSNQRLEDETLEEYSARLVDVICKKPDETYTRYEIVRLDHELEAARRDLWVTVQQIERDRDLGAPRNPSACHKYGGTCDFFGVCTGADSLDNVHNFKRPKTAHPELT